MADTTNAPVSEAPKAAKAPIHPPTASLVNEAIAKLNKKEGSSLQAIKKYIADAHKVDIDKLAPFIRKYLKGAVEKGTLLQPKGKGASGSFKLAVKAKKLAATKAAIRVNEDEKLDYMKLNVQEIESAWVHVKDAKKLLENILQRRQNAMQYSTLTTVVKTESDTVESAERKIVLEQDLKCRQNQQKELTEKLHQTHEQLRELVTRIYHLKEMFDEQPEPELNQLTEQKTDDPISYISYI